ncbi:MAG TPA: MarR family transcriptional regulator [Ktedonobacterales bacterium]|jgi:DNA-binding MarR family transcriptional regulator|nr:MarR family transcriptional regulator [Ktedonobacterales bacterium]
MPIEISRDRQPAAGRDADQDELTKAEYEQLAEFRHSIRELARQTELEVRALGMTPQQYQVLLAIKGMPGREWASISEIAERLQIRHNAVIGLVNRAVARGLLRRGQDGDQRDRRVVQVHLTHSGEHLLTLLAAALRQERLHVRTALESWNAVEHAHGRR